MNYRLTSTDDDLRSSADAFVLAESSGDGEVAEAALRSMFRALPSPRPAVDFAARVLAAAPAAVHHGVARARVVRDLAPRQRWLVAAAAVSLAVCLGLAIAYLLPVATVLLGQVEWAAMTASVAAGFGHLLTLADRVALLARTAFALLRALLVFLTSPQVFAALLLSTAVAGLCLRLLQELLHSPRNPAHASS